MSFTDVSKFSKYCPSCRMMYRYQEWMGWTSQLWWPHHSRPAFLPVFEDFTSGMDETQFCSFIWCYVLIFPLSDTQCSKQSFWSHRAVIWVGTAQSQQGTPCIFTLWSPYCTWIHILVLNTGIIHLWLSWTTTKKVFSTCQVSALV